MISSKTPTHESRRTNTPLTLGGVAAPAFKGMLLLALAAPALVGFDVPLIGTAPGALAAVGLFGMALCGGGPLGNLIATRRYLSWAMIAGSTLGLAALTLVVAGIAGWPLPFAADARTALTALVCVLALKCLVGAAYRLTS